MLLEAIDLTLAIFDNGHQGSQSMLLDARIELAGWFPTANTRYPEPKEEDLELLPLSRRHVLQPTAKDFIVLGKCNISGYEVCPGHSFSSSNSELSSANASTIPIMSPSSKPSTLTLVPLSPLSPRDMNASMGSTKSHPCLLDLKSQQPCPDKNGFFDSQRNPRSKSFPKLTSSWI